MRDTGEGSAFDSESSSQSVHTVGTMASLLAGRKLITKDGSAAPADALEGKVVLLYFSASWCPPCHRFTPILADFYDDVLSVGGNVEIVYVPGDRARDEMMEYFNDLHGDWLALDMTESSLIQQLNQRYEVSGIPALLAVQTDGSVIEARCREQVQSRGPAAWAAWAAWVAAWRPPAFGGAAHALGGGRGGGVSRLVAGPAGGGGGAAADERLSARPARQVELRQGDGAISTSGRARISEHWAVGDLCEVEGKGAGVVQFAGEAAPTGGRGGFFLGIALEHARGTHDGALFGTRYFTCRDGHGVMTSRLGDVKFLGRAERAHHMPSHGGRPQSGAPRRVRSPPPRARSPPRRVRGEYHVGENVEYFSQRSDEWIDATVTRLHSDGAVTLDIKEYADPAKIRRVTSAAPAPARAPGSPQDFPRARSPPRRVRGGYRAGDRVEYYSVSSSASSSLMWSGCCC